jgi:hypothetical protein
MRRYDHNNLQLGALSRDKTALSTGRIGGINLKTKQHRLPTGNLLNIMD